MAKKSICRKCSTMSITTKQTVSSAKSTVTLFTLDIHEHQIHPQVKLVGHVLPIEWRPKLFGVTLDTQLTFTHYCNNIAVKVQQRSKLEKARPAYLWLRQKTLLKTYQIIGRSILSHCCLDWTPSPKDTKWRKIRR